MAQRRKNAHFAAQSDKDVWRWWMEKENLDVRNPEQLGLFDEEDFSEEAA